MATQNITISSTSPVMLLTSANQKSALIANLDTANSVFLSSDPIGSVGAVELTAGSTISWDSYTGLYAFVLAGNAVKVLVLDNGGTYNNGVAVANALMASGLASSIATQIALNGAPSIDVPAILYSGTFNYQTYTGQIDVSKYSSVSIIITQTTAADVNQHAAAVTFYATADNSVLLNEYTFVSGGVKAGGQATQSTLTVPVYGKTMLVKYPGVLTTAFTGTITVVGSLRTVSDAQWSMRNAQVGTQPSNQEGQTVAALGNGTVYDLANQFIYYSAGPAAFTAVKYSPDYSRSGRVHITLSYEGTAGSVIFGILDRISNAVISPLQSITNTLVTYDFTIGYRPFDIYVGATTPNGPLRFVITTD